MHLVPSVEAYVPAARATRRERRGGEVREGYEHRRAGSGVHRTGPGQSSHSVAPTAAIAPGGQTKQFLFWFPAVADWSERPANGPKVPAPQVVHKPPLVASLVPYVPAAAQGGEARG